MCKLNRMTKACGMFLLWAAAAIALPAQTYTSLVDFDGTNGEYPSGTLVQGLDSNFYGTTGGGGASGDGTVFKVTPGGSLTTLYSFCSETNCTDGSGPEAGLVLGTDGNFYGTTAQGGTSAACDARFTGCGTTFKITPGGLLTTLHVFEGPDGEAPGGPLVQANDGNFYGTTESGGAKHYYGEVFRITPDGALTVVYSFCQLAGSADGELPSSGAIQAVDGDLYGTATGGANACENQGGQGCGMVFKLTLGGTLTTLYSFPNPYPWDPNGLIQATDGNFYGSTYYGGACVIKEGCGTVFEITPSGTLTNLHTFEQTDGQWPSGGLAQGTNGYLFGTTSQGGDVSACYEFGCGTVFSLGISLGPFVTSLPPYGKVGAKVGILGTRLTGTTSVTFDGTPATFTVKSSTLITTAVPAGGTTGTVQVVTPSGTLNSNIPFIVE
jgi:uncharacterized repeat protein (TIGR03803 family)